MMPATTAIDELHGFGHDGCIQATVDGSRGRARPNFSL
jgi:hypothetical protein